MIVATIQAKNRCNKYEKSFLLNEGGYRDGKL